MLFKLFSIMFIFGYLLHAFISGSIRLLPVPYNIYRRRTHILGLFCFSVVTLSPLMWVTFIAEQSALIDTNDQLITNLWNCVVMAAPVIAVGCIAYLHKALLSYEDRLPDLDDEGIRGNPLFRRSGDLPARIKRKYASAKPIKTLTVPVAAVHVPLLSEQPDFEDTLASLFQENQTSLKETAREQDLDSHRLTAGEAADNVDGIRMVADS